MRFLRHRNLLYVLSTTPVRLSFNHPFLQSWVKALRCEITNPLTF